MIGGLPWWYLALLVAALVVPWLRYVARDEWRRRRYARVVLREGARLAVVVRTLREQLEPRPTIEHSVLPYDWEQQGL